MTQGLKLQAKEGQAAAIARPKAAERGRKDAPLELAAVRAKAEAAQRRERAVRRPRTRYVAS